MSVKTVTVLEEMMYFKEDAMYRGVNMNIYTTVKKAMNAMWEAFEDRQGYDVSKISPFNIYSSIDYTCKNSMGTETFYRIVITKKEVL